MARASSGWVCWNCGSKYNAYRTWKMKAGYKITGKENFCCEECFLVKKKEWKV
jgi:hypothetical protein